MFISKTDKVINISILVLNRMDVLIVENPPLEKVKAIVIINVIDVLKMNCVTYIVIKIVILNEIKNNMQNTTMTSPNLKKLTNDMRTIEERVYEKLDKENFNVIKIQFEDKNWEDVERYAEEFLDNGQATYCYYTTINVYLLMNVTDENCYRSKLIDEIKSQSTFSNTKVTLIHFKSMTEFITYFSLKNHQYFMFSMQNFGKLTKSQINNETLKELQDRLGDEWKKVPDFKKYGVHRKGSDRFSGKIDSRENTFNVFLS